MLPIDSLLLFFFIAINVSKKEWLGWTRIGTETPPDLSSVILITLGTIYLLIDIIYFFEKISFFSKIKTFLFFLILLVLVGFPLFSNIMARHNSVNYLFIHDGALQTEIASRFLLKGKNPYALNYFGTPLESWQYVELDHKEAKNPALYHYVYLPFFLISSTVGHIIQKIALGWEDIRFTLFAEYILAVAVFWCFVKNIKNKFLYLTLFAANPLIVHFLVEGRNDTSSFLWLLIAAFFIIRKNIAGGALFLALALLFKQTLWLSAPFFFYYIFFSEEIRKKRFLFTSIFFAAFATIMAPFLLWDPKSFLDSTIGYMSGTAINSYPIHSIGFGQVLLFFHIIKDSHDYFPFWIFQLIFVFPVFFFFIKANKKIVKISSVFLFFGIAMLLFLYFSRAFSDSYLILIFLSIITSFFLHEKEKSENKLVL